MVDDFEEKRSSHNTLNPKKFTDFEMIWVKRNESIFKCPYLQKVSFLEV